MREINLNPVIKIIPEIGKLYKFREDNIEATKKKYGYYYTGLLMCIQEDVDSTLDIPKKFAGKKVSVNPLYQFEVYNCYQHFEQMDFFGRTGVEIKTSLFLSLWELNDTVEDAYGKQS